MDTTNMSRCEAELSFINDQIIDIIPLFLLFRTEQFECQVMSAGLSGKSQAPLAPLLVGLSRSPHPSHYYFIRKKVMSCHAKRVELINFFIIYNEIYT